MAPILLPALDLATRANQYVERSDTLHLSTIITDLLIGLDPQRYGQGRDGDDGKKYANFMAGLIFERALELAWFDRERQARPGLIRPGEVTLDGITGTPDAFDTQLGRPEEYKFTKKSCRQPITDNKFWHYWVQLKAYAYMTGATEGVLVVCHVNGNYSRDDADPDSGYVIRPWLDRWTDTELKDNWKMIVGHARRRGWLPTIDVKPIRVE